MKPLIIIPAHNEEENIAYCLKSLEAQTFRDFRVVIVNDGSTDHTSEIAKTFADSDERFQVLDLQKSEHEPGAKVVRTFYKGLETQELSEFDVVCKFDADIVFPSNYLEKITEIYSQNPKAGMVSGLVFIQKKGMPKTELLHFENQEGWEYENLSSQNHIRGPIKSYRVECLKDMGGLRTVLGWDNIDVMLAKMHGWETVSIKNIWVKHLRPTAYKYKRQKSEKLGIYFYNIGLNFPLAVISSVKSAFKNKLLSEFFITMKSFLKQNQPRQLSKNEIKFIRKLR
ncbi:MAG: glycosyltransferase family A protein, partial [Cruoricaptor ignavus]|nr:glycosyltransferase family A protein [Cruoricaptor ignavus]